MEGECRYSPSFKMCLSQVVFSYPCNTITLYMVLNVSNHMESNVSKWTQPGARISLRMVMLKSIRNGTRIYHNVRGKIGMADSHMYWKDSVILEAENQEQWYECFVLYHIYIQQTCSWNKTRLNVLLNQNLWTVNTKATELASSLQFVFCVLHTYLVAEW